MQPWKITPFFYNNFFGFRGGGIPSPPHAVATSIWIVPQKQLFRSWKGQRFLLSISSISEFWCHAQYWQHPTVQISLCLGAISTTHSVLECLCESLSNDGSYGGDLDYFFYLDVAWWVSSLIIFSRPFISCSKVMPSSLKTMISLIKFLISFWIAGLLIYFGYGFWNSNERFIRKRTLLQDGSSSSNEFQVSIICKNINP